MPTKYSLLLLFPSLHSTGSLQHEKGSGLISEAPDTEVNKNYYTSINSFLCSFLIHLIKIVALN